MSTFIWFLIAYASAYMLGKARGEEHEREREERAYKHAEENVIYMKDHR